MNGHHGRSHAERHAGCCEAPYWHHGYGWGGPEHRGHGCCCCCSSCHCGHSGHHGDCSCGRGEALGFHRRFESREEKTARLEAYLADLRAEAQAVEEELARFRKSE